MAFPVGIRRETPVAESFSFPRSYRCNSRFQFGGTCHRNKLSAALLLLVLLLLSCSGGSHVSILAQPPTASLLVSQTVSITAVVSGSLHKNVLWSVCDGSGNNCLLGGNSSIGTILEAGRDPDGNSIALFTAPASVPAPPACLATSDGCAVAVKGDLVDFAGACFATITVHPPPSPAPQINLIRPSSATAGGQSFTLIVDGSGFLSSSTVRWNGEDRPTTFLSSDDLRAGISALDIASPGTAQVTVFNPPPGGGTSNALTFTINPATPATQPGVIERVSVASAGTESNGDSLASTKSLSADGRFVAFDSFASNLVPGDTNALNDVFVRDTCLGAPTGCTPSTIRVSVANDGMQGNSESFQPSLSADGRFVAFHSFASNLVPGDTNALNDVFVRDTCLGATGCTPSTVRVSVDSNGVQANNQSAFASLSADGRFVAFHSFASNLVTDDTNFFDDIFLRDTCFGASAVEECSPSTIRVSVSSTGTQTDDVSDSPAISATGRFVAFVSPDPDLVANDTNNLPDVFVRDTCFGATGCTPSTIRVSVSTAGTQGNNNSVQPSISADERFVAFHSLASNLVPGDTNARVDVFVRDTCFGAAGCTPATLRVSVDSDGIQANDQSVVASLSADGRFVAFHSLASNLVPDDTNARVDVFVRDTCFGATGCTPSTVRVSVDTNGVQANNQSAFASLSADGRFVVFHSFASNLVLNDTNGAFDVFLARTGF